MVLKITSQVIWFSENHLKMWAELTKMNKDNSQFVPAYDVVYFHQAIFFPPLLIHLRWIEIAIKLNLLPPKKDEINKNNKKNTEHWTWNCNLIIWLNIVFFYIHRQTRKIYFCTSSENFGKQKNAVYLGWLWVKNVEYDSYEALSPAKASKIVTRRVQ